MAKKKAREPAPTEAELDELGGVHAEIIARCEAVIEATDENSEPKIRFDHMGTPDAHGKMKFSEHPGTPLLDVIGASPIEPGVYTVEANAVELKTFIESFGLATKIMINQAKSKLKV